MRAMILRLVSGVVLMLAAAGPALAQNAFFTPGGANVNGIVQMCLNASGAAVPCSDATAVASAATVNGNVASGVADAGNPVKIGGASASGTPSAVTTGQRVNGWWSLNGAAITGYPATTGVDGMVNTQMLTPATPGGVSFGAQPVAGMLFNGSTWDRQYACNSTSIVNVTAGSTTEIVPLTASQIIRVCSFAVSMSAAGTAQFLYGTGTNCGTGTTSLSGAMPLATGTPMELAAGQGNLFRTASANALCVAAVTGNVVGFVTYAKY